MALVGWRRRWCGEGGVKRGPGREGEAGPTVLAMAEQEFEALRVTPGRSKSSGAVPSISESFRVIPSYFASC